MATPSQQGDFVTLDPVTVWWSPKTPDEIHVTCNDPDLVHPNTGPGMRIVFSSNPLSANFHPSNFNRCRQMLIQQGKPAPPEPAVEGDRRLDRRPIAGFHIELVRRETDLRSSFNVYLCNGTNRFLLNNRPVEQARAYAEKLRAILTPRIQVIET